MVIILAVAALVAAGMALHYQKKYLSALRGIIEVRNAMIESQKEHLNTLGQINARIDVMIEAHRKSSEAKDKMITQLKELLTDYTS